MARLVGLYKGPPPRLPETQIADSLFSSWTSLAPTLLGARSLPVRYNSQHAFLPFRFPRLIALKFFPRSLILDIFGVVKLQILAAIRLATQLPCDLGPLHC